MAEKEYPSNSLLPKSSLDRGAEIKQKQSAQGEDDIPQKVIKGKAAVKKKSVGKKLADVFLSADIGSVLDHIVYDMVVPKIKEAILGAVSIALTGSAYRPARTEEKSHTDFTSFSKRESRPEPSPSIRTLGSDIAFDTLDDARFVLDDMRDRIRDNGYVSVRALYGFAGLPCDYTKASYGWRNLDDAGVLKGSDGYYLRLPRPEYLRR